MLGHRHRRCRGNSLVELVLLVPLYVLIIAGALLLGELALVKMQSHEANEYAAYQSGDQSESDGLRQSGPMKATYWPPYLGTLDLREGEIGQVPSQDEIGELLEKMTELAYAAVAHGSYVFENGELRFKITTSQNRWRSQEGERVLKLRLLEGNVPKLSEDTLTDYMDRNRVDTSFNFAPDYLTWSRFGLEGADVQTRYQASRRLDLVREVDRRFGAPNAPIEKLTPRFGDGPGTLPDYPSFMDTKEFWKPN